MENIKIGWKDYKIIKGKPNQDLIFNGLDCYGHIKYDDCKILLNEENSEKQMECTLIHEILHGISEMYSLDMSEDLVTRLGNAISTTLEQNNLEIKTKIK